MKIIVCLLVVIAVSQAFHVQRDERHGGKSSWSSSSRLSSNEYERESNTRNLDGRQYGRQQNSASSSSSEERGSQWSSFNMKDLPNDIVESIKAIENKVPISRKPCGSLSAEDVKFYLYTRPENKVHLTSSNLNKLDTNKKIKMILHGWLENSEQPWILSMVKSYFKNTENNNYNVIVVDWHKPAFKTYGLSASFVAPVAKRISDFIVSNNLPANKLHLVGFSMGAQVAGRVGKYLKQQNGQELRRITALDPAGPCFQEAMYKNEERLTSDDATIVDVTHTDAGYFGAEGKIGTIDFYPNGGQRQQPGCQSSEEGLPCDTTRAVYYYIQSIREPTRATKCSSFKAFMQKQCESEPKTQYGERFDGTQTGRFYFKTRSQSPFWQN